MWLDYLNTQVKQLDNWGLKLKMVNPNFYQYSNEFQYASELNSLSFEIIDKRLTQLSLFINFLDTYIFIDINGQINIEFNYFDLDIDTNLGYSEKSKLQVAQFFNTFIHNSFFITLTKYKDAKIEYIIDYNNKGWKSKRMIFSSILELDNFIEGDTWYNKFIRLLVFRFNKEKVKKIHYEFKNGQMVESHVISE